MNCRSLSVRCFRFPGIIFDIASSFYAADKRRITEKLKVFKDFFFKENLQNTVFSIRKIVTVISPPGAQDAVLRTCKEATAPLTRESLAGRRERKQVSFL